MKCCEYHGPGGQHDGDRLIAFELEQSGLSDITRRYTLGAFGRGSYHPWNIWGEKQGDADAVIHYPDGAVRAFFLPQPVELNPIVTYAGGRGDYGELVYTTGVGWKLTEADGTKLVFESDPADEDRFVLDYVEDLNGNRTTVNYTSERVTSVTDSTGDTVTYTYDANGRVVKVTDAVGRETTCSYDPSGEHLLSMADATGTKSITYVTGQGAAREHAVQSITYPDGTHSFFEYDDRGRLTRTWADGGTEELTFAYDSVGNVTATDALGNAIVVMSNEFGAVGQITDPFGLATRARYDADGNLLSLTAESGVSASFGYNAGGNLTSIINPLGVQTSLSYEAYGRLTELTDALGHTLEFDYDDDYNVIGNTHPDGSGDQYAYDARGNLIEWTNARGDVVTYTYDAHDLMTRKEHDSGYYADYTYDANRNLLSATDPGGATSFEYDAADRITRVTYPDGRYLDYAYDAGGRRIRMADSDGTEVNYAYDAVGRLAGLTDSVGAPIVTYTYDPAGRLVQAGMGNGTYTTYDYDAAGNIQHLVNHAPDDSVASRFDYTYDDLGRRVSMTTLEGDWTYSYDASGQLVGVETPDGRTIQYEYDAVGNRISVIDDGTTTAYATNSMNQYTVVDGSTYAYDADGNLIERTDGDDTWTYEYDAEGRLVAMTTPEGTWTYEYDALGNRTAVTHDGQRTEYLIDPFGFGNVVAEYDGTDSLVATYTHGLGLVSRDDAATGAAYYGFDASANTVQMTDVTGAVLSSYSYLPFGEVLHSSEAIPNPFTFVGQFGVMDDDGDLYFMRNRHYEPSLGRFVQTDPIGLAGGDANLYQYAYNTPTHAADPTGTSTFTTVLGVVMILGGAYLITEGHPICGGLLIIGGAVVGYTGNANSAPLEQPQIGEDPNQPQYSTEYWTGLPQEDLIYNPTLITIFQGPSAWFNPHQDHNVPNNESSDPNDVLGPDGYGVEGYIRPDLVLPYTIRCENDPEATAAAQVISITHQLDADVDWSAFQLGSFGFGEHTFYVPVGLQTYSQRLDLRNELDLYVDVDFALDADTGEVTWEFTSIDPVTGQQTADPLAGFLPPNDTSPEGEGFVNYTVEPLPGLPTGTEITAQARIVFDTNDPIDTNEHLNTIDAGPPTSSVDPLSAEVIGPSVVVSWTGEDDPGGSGVARYDVYVSDNGGPFEPWLNNTTDTSGRFAGRLEHTYAFFSIATDNVGHGEALPLAADLQTTLVGTDLGIVDFLELPGLDPSGEDLWYQLATTRPGILTTEAVFAGLPDSVQLALYDEQASLLDTSTLMYGNQRIDWDVQGGQTYLVKLSGANTDVKLRLANLVEVSLDGTQMTVYDTDGDDLLEARAGDPGGGVPRTVVINGVRYESNLLTVMQCFAGDGYNAASFYDSPGDDTFTAMPGSATLAGNPYSFEALGFDVVHAYAKAGGHDAAHLYDSVDDDKLIGTPIFGKLKFNDENHHFVRAKFFEGVHAYSKAGGRDVGYLYDSPGDDLLEAEDNWVKLSPNHAQSDVLFRAIAFESVTATSTTGNDTKIVAPEVDFLELVGNWQD